MSVAFAEFRCSRCRYEVAVRHSQNMARRIDRIDECPECGADLDIVDGGGEP